MTRLRVDWSRKNTTDVDPTIRRFERWLVENGYREACVQTYTGAVKKFLVEVKSANPTLDAAMTWHGDLAESKLARSTVNIVVLHYSIERQRRNLKRKIGRAVESKDIRRILGIRAQLERCRLDLDRMKRDYTPPKPAFRRSYGYDAFVEGLIDGKKPKDLHASRCRSS